MNLGFIGGGNMATALISGVVKGGVLPPSQVHVYDILQDCRSRLSRELGVTAHEDMRNMIARCDVVVLAVKPNVAKTALAEAHDALPGKGLISIVTGWTSEMLAAALPEDTRLLRVMPNTPALCGEGMTGLSEETTLNETEKAFAEAMFGTLGRYLWVHEALMEAVVGVSGSGPAYGYLFIEALADAGVEMGLTRAQAQQMAAQTLKGAAEMVLSTGRHPGALKDAVCSPAGTTIAAVRVLEEKGFRGAVMDGALAAWRKALDMKKA